MLGAAPKTGRGSALGKEKGRTGETARPGKTATLRGAQPATS